MAASDFNMEDVYPLSGDNLKINTEVTLQFGDFEPGNIESSDVENLSIISQNSKSQDSIGHLSLIQSSGGGSHSVPYPVLEDADNIPKYSHNDMLQIVSFAHNLLSKNKKVVPSVQIKQEHLAPIVATKTIKIEPIPSPKQPATVAEEKLILLQVSRKDYCAISVENTKLLKEIQLSTSNPGKNSSTDRLEKLYMVINETGLLSMVKQQRRIPIISDASPLGFRESSIIYRPENSESDFSTNQFLDAAGTYDPVTWTQIIPLPRDDIVCYKFDLLVLKKLMTLAFDSTLLLFEQASMKAGKYIEAFQNIILRVRGTKQSDIDKARDNLLAFTCFDSSVEVNISMAALTRLMSDVEFSTGVPLPEDERLRKFHQCAFNDERLPMHTSVVDSIAKSQSFQESVDQLFLVMGRLPLNKQVLKQSSQINSLTTTSGTAGKGSKITYCYDFQIGKCKKVACKFAHEINAEATERARKFNSDKKGGGGGKQDKFSDIKKPFRVALSETDRKFFGAPRGKPSPNNKEGWSGPQRQAINAIIASDYSRQSPQGRSHNRDGYEYDLSPDELSEQYFNAVNHSSPAGSSRSRSELQSSRNGPNSSYSHHMNSLRHAFLPTSHESVVEVRNREYGVGTQSFKYGMGDTYLADADIHMLCSYYEDESMFRFSKCILTLLLSQSLLRCQSITFCIRKLVFPEVFPIIFIEGLVLKILDFLIVPLSGEEVRSVCDSIVDTHCDPEDLYNEGSDYWDSKSDRSVDSDINHHWLNSFGLYDRNHVFNSVSQKRTYIDSGASLCGTPDIKNLQSDTICPCPQFVVHGSIGSSSAQPIAQGLYGPLQLEMVVMKELNSTLLSVSAICDGGKSSQDHVCIFSRQSAGVYLASGVSSLLQEVETTGVKVMSFVRDNNLYALQSEVPSEVRMFLFNIRNPSPYNELHRVTGHGSILNQQWHRKNSVNAEYTPKDALINSQIICSVCVRANMRRSGVDPHREHRPEIFRPGQQFTIDGYTHPYVSRGGNSYADIVTDLASKAIYALPSKTKTALEFIASMEKLFTQNPDWFVDRKHEDDRFYRVDPEGKYISDLVISFMSGKGYRIERTPPRDKSAGGVAESSVGRIENATNTAMLAVIPQVPQSFWDHAMTYAANTLNINYSSSIGTSPYTYTTGNKVDVRKLHGFWDSIWVLIPKEQRDSKVGCDRAMKGRWLGYLSFKIQYELHVVLVVSENNKYGKVAITKDVLFDAQMNFNVTTRDEEPYDREWKDPDSYVPFLMRAKAPVQLQGPVISIPHITVPCTSIPSRVLRSQKSLYSDKDKSSEVPRRVPKKNPSLLSSSFTENGGAEAGDSDILRRPSTTDDLEFDMNLDQNDADPTFVYFNFLSTMDEGNEFNCFLAYVETSHHYMFSMANTSGTIPRSHDDAVNHLDPKWHASVIKEKTKFETNNTLSWVPYRGQSLNNLIWLFREKEDSARTASSRLVLDGSRMIPGRDYDTSETYCGNVSASSIKIALIIASAYNLFMKKADVNGAFLGAPNKSAQAVFVNTPQGYQRQPGMCLQVTGNVYGHKSAGYFFDDDFSDTITSLGWVSCAYDRKFFWKWIDELPLILITHSDDFAMFLRESHMYEWDKLLAALKHKGYNCDNRDTENFVGINIQRLPDGGYSMNQRQAIEKLLQSVDMMGVNEERLPYPTQQQQPESLSKRDNLDNLTTDIGDSEKDRVKKFPFRACVGSLLYVMIHTMPQIMFILNVLSRFCNNHGPRHIFFMEHLLRFVKGVRFDLIVYPPHDGPYDIVTMTNLLQVNFHIDSELGGNIDNGKAQTCWLGFLHDMIFTWNSTTQGSLSTATTESEIKAINHTLKCETISNIGMLNAMGFKQNPVIIHEDNMAAVFAARQPNMTRGLKHLDLNEMFFKEKQAQGVIKVVKIHTDDNKADLGTKRVGWPIFAKVVSSIIVCKNKFFKKYFEKME